MADRMETPDDLGVVADAAVAAEMAVIEAQITDISTGVADRMKANGWGSRADGPRAPISIRSLDSGLKGTFSDNDWATVGSHE